MPGINDEENDGKRRAGLDHKSEIPRNTGKDGKEPSATRGDCGAARESWEDALM